MEEQEEAQAKEVQLEQQITEMVLSEEAVVRSKDPLALAEVRDSDDKVPLPEVPMSLAEQEAYDKACKQAEEDAKKLEKEKGKARGPPGNSKLI